jgi:hypothetical protein
MSSRSTAAQSLKLSSKSVTPFNIGAKQFSKLHIPKSKSILKKRVAPNVIDIIDYNIGNKANVFKS